MTYEDRLALRKKLMGFNPCLDLNEDTSEELTETESEQEIAYESAPEWKRKAKYLKERVNPCKYHWATQQTNNNSKLYDNIGPMDTSVNESANQKSDYVTPSATSKKVKVEGNHEVL